MHRYRYGIIAILLALLLVSCAAPRDDGSTANTQNQAAQAQDEEGAIRSEGTAQNHLYYYVRPQLINKTIPLHLPSYIPPGKEEIIKQGLVAQIVEQSTDDAYKITIAQPNCGDATACTYASMGGLKPTENTPSLEEKLEERLSPDLEFSEEASFAPGKVELTQGTQGIQGYLFPWFIGAYQTETQVFWQEGDYRYWVGAKGASKDEIIKMANSAINNDEGGEK